MQASHVSRHLKEYVDIDLFFPSQQY